jgi:hypothetical protein
MVLQTNAEYGARSFLSGKADPNEKVTITGGAGNYAATADDSGDWKVMLNPQHTGHTMTVTVKGETGDPSVADNCVAGDVYFCSGQVCSRTMASDICQLSSPLLRSRIWCSRSRSPSTPPRRPPR